MTIRSMRTLSLLVAALMLALVGGSAVALGDDGHDHGTKAHHAGASAQGDDGAQAGDDSRHSHEAAGDHGRHHGHQGGRHDERSDRGDDEDHGRGADDNEKHPPKSERNSCSSDEHSAWDEQWLMTSIEGDRFEIAGGMLAQQRGTTQAVRDLGATLVEDHSKSLEDATKVAKDLGIDVPDEPSPVQQWELRAVAQFQGQAFDLWYADLEVQDHIQDIQESQDEVDMGCNPKVRHLAEDDLPVLRKHLTLARAALEAAGGQAPDAKASSSSGGGDENDRFQRRDEGCGSQRFSAWDEQWLTMSIEGDLFEITGGRLAQDRAATQPTRDLGALLVEDHTKSLKDATEVARDLGIEVPDEPSPTQQWDLRAVAQFQGQAFDRWYADLEVQDHMQDIQEAKDEVDQGCNTKIRGLAKDDLPVLQHHLEVAQDVLRGVGG